MTFITHTSPRVLIADEGKPIREKNDVYVPEHTDPETGEVIPEHFPHYATLIFPGIQIQTLEEIEEIYIEELIEDE